MGLFYIDLFRNDIFHLRRINPGVFPAIGGSSASSGSARAEPKARSTGGGLPELGQGSAQGGNGSRRMQIFNSEMDSHLSPIKSHCLKSGFPFGKA